MIRMIDDFRLLYIVVLRNTGDDTVGSETSRDYLRLILLPMISDL